MHLQITDLRKTYSNGVPALQGINLTIGTGLFGLLGPNGAGKSTLMRTIATLQLPDEGKVEFDGFDVAQDPERLRRQLGYLPQEFGVYPKVSAEALLQHLAVLKGIKSASERKAQVEYLLNKTNLWTARKKNLGTYSGGMKQRFGIAQALLGNPRLIIVDEPTAGLDPGERARFHNLLSELGAETIVILSTHIVDDVANLCQDMAIVNKGQVLFSGTPVEGLAQVKGKVYARTIERSQITDYQQRYQVLSVRLVAGKPTVFAFSEADPGEGFVPSEAGLEEVYFHHVSHA